VIRKSLVDIIKSLVKISHSKVENALDYAKEIRSNI